MVAAQRHGFDLEPPFESCPHQKTKLSQAELGTLLEMVHQASWGGHNNVCQTTKSHQPAQKQQGRKISSSTLGNAALGPIQMLIHPRP